MCGWFEPAMWELAPPPECDSIFTTHSHPQDGGFSRINDCKLVYGPLNCNFLPRSASDSQQQFSDASIQGTSMCAAPPLLCPNPTAAVPLSLYCCTPPSAIAPSPLPV